MLSFTSRRCWAVLTARLHGRSFALAAGVRLDRDELQRLVDEARRPCEPGLRPGQAKTLRENVQRLVRNAGLGPYGALGRSNLCELDTDFLLELILEQEGMCAYSCVDVELLLHGSDWQMSLEPKDYKHGYRRNNVALIAQEFNSMVWISKKAAFQGCSQWSRQKVEQLRLERDKHVDLENLRRRIDLAAGSENFCGNWEEICTEHVVGAEPGTLKCSLCGVWKPLWQFSPFWRNTRHFSSLCEPCRGQCTWTKTLRRSVQAMIHSARGRHNLGMWHGDFELGADDVLGKLWAQRGRCFYSGVPLRYGQSNVDWLMSLERLENTKTYTKENTRLVALEFTVVDQWSREKVQFVWGDVL
eukprot:s1751_g12.t1